MTARRSGQGRERISSGTLWPESARQVKSCFQLRDNPLLTGNQLIRNSRDCLERAAIQIQSKKLKFVDTFAPAGHKPDKTLDLQLALIFLTIPSTTRGTMFWKGGMKNLDAFASSVKHDAFKDTSQAMVTASYQIGRQFVAKATAKEVSFHSIYDHRIRAWTEQHDNLTLTLFDGSDQQIRSLIMGNGNIVAGSRNCKAQGSDFGEYASANTLVTYGLSPSNSLSLS